MTWGQFKQAVEKQGVKDDNEIDYIDIDSYEMDSLKVSWESYPALCESHAMIHG